MGASPTQQPLQPEAIGAVMEVTKWGQSRGSCGRKIRSRASTRTADAPCFQRVISLFSLCYLLLEKLSKSLIPLGDCPFVLNRLPVFLENLFPGKTGPRPLIVETFSIIGMVGHRKGLASRKCRTESTLQTPKAANASAIPRYAISPASDISDIPKDLRHQCLFVLSHARF
jgi:hypothetical protein